MAEKPYTLESDEKATAVMIGTPDMLLWGDLVTKETVQLSGFLNTLAEEFVPLRAAKILFLAPVQQAAPVSRPVVYLKLEEILLFYGMAGAGSLPEESDVRRYEPIEAIVGSFQIEASILKSPVARLQNMLLVAREAYFSFYRATIRHAAKPWLGTFSADVVQVRRDRMTVTTS
jgi:hypothetical protein